MKNVQIDDRVRLKHDVPELGLHRGEVGVVRTTWRAPVNAFEVEFQPKGLDHPTRALLLSEQLQPEK